MSEEFKKLNEKYNDETYPEFPYISKNRVTLLKRGLYRKHNAKYRGITAVYDEETEEFSYPLYGMYFIEEDLVIVPESLNLNENKKAFLIGAEKAGFKTLPDSGKALNDLDEASSAYKDIDIVMKEQKDLVDIVVKLEPMVVIKG